MKYLTAFFLIVLLSFNFANATEEGFIYNGKSYTTFKDGKKTGITLADLQEKDGSKDKNAIRLPAQKAPAGHIGNTAIGAVYWIRDNTANGNAITCYISSSQGDISCVKE